MDTKFNTYYELSDCEHVRFALRKLSRTSSDRWIESGIAHIDVRTRRQALRVVKLYNDALPEPTDAELAELSG